MTWIANKKTAAALAVGAIGALALGVAGPAQAHSYIVASSPAEGSTIAEVPEQFSVTANELLLDLAGDANGFAIQVVDAATRYYGDGCVSVSGSTMSMGATLGEPGEYRMFWQVISADGHVVAGEIPFEWAPADGAVTTPGLAAPPVCGETGVEPTPTAEPTTPAEPDDATEEPEPEVTAIAAPEAASDSTPVFVGVGIAALAVVAVIVIAVVARSRRRAAAASGDSDTAGESIAPERTEGEE
ncbi:methionine-rich copper-binding protein CopC [Microbacteriaceae bacterium SG_E_30_P1]|uniref:Methionine-rich copper-binding protein CopC n=1 Tax=Antiquaquibacter oligotrophicus TaxID=2880260 RepID=A0ABT6KN20_9MICO|nr:copper resistance protein CopC [Antiquaquibacter oligotrophicus]MDH6181249.1 methionine-rich copper-binding protein CopC [Antiquaquibacter oligotrophicus]UDF13056.1 copper resistance protein CopC [Antiquaquibacter oligotrophicus]